MKRLFAILLAVSALFMFALPAASDSGGDRMEPDGLYAMSGIDACAMDAQVVCALANAGAIESTFILPNGEKGAAVAHSTGNFWEDLGLYGYCSPDGTGQTSLVDTPFMKGDAQTLTAYEHIDPGRAGESLIT